MADEIRFTKSTRGHDKLIYQGYMFTRHRSNRQGVVWRCHLRGQCTATVTVSEDGRSVIKEQSPHTNHTKHWGRVNARECFQNMKMSEQEKLYPEHVYAQEEINDFPDELLMCLNNELQETSELKNNDYKDSNWNSCEGDCVYIKEEVGSKSDMLSDDEEQEIEKADVLKTESSQRYDREHRNIEIENETDESSAYSESVKNYCTDFNKTDNVDNVQINEETDNFKYGDCKVTSSSRGDKVEKATPAELYAQQNILREELVRGKREIKLNNRNDAGLSGQQKSSNFEITYPHVHQRKSSNNFQNICSPTTSSVSSDLEVIEPAVVTTNASPATVTATTSAAETSLPNLTSLRRNKRQKQDETEHLFKKALLNFKQSLTAPSILQDDADVLIGKSVEICLKNLADYRVKVKFRRRFRQLVQECEEAALMSSP